MKSYFVPAGMGWQKDLPDSRDYTIDHPEVKTVLDYLGFGSPTAELPDNVDLRLEGVLPPPADQLGLGSSCAFAVLDLVEFLERTRLGRSLEGSRLFLHQLSLGLSMPRAEARAVCMPGATLRNTFKALTRVGSPPADLWPYDQEHFDRRPMDPLLFSFTREYQSIRYVRLDVAPDHPGRLRAPEQTLEAVKRLLAIGVPCVCGISLPRSLTMDPWVQLPSARDEPRGGQAVMVVGYDADDFGAKRKRSRPAKQSQGSLLIRSSWGTQWGEDGHGRLPQAYVETGLASDFWTVVKSEWMPPS